MWHQDAIKAALGISGVLSDETGSNKSVHLTFVTTCGIRRNENAGMVQSEVTLDDLFT